MAMVFTLVSTLKDEAELLMADRQRQAENVHAMEVRKREEEENRRFFGTKVTPERFLEWRNKFRHEMAEREAKRREEEEAEERKRGGAKATAAKTEEKRMTGKGLWLRGLAGKEAVEEEDDGEDGVVEGVQGLKVAA